MGQERTEPLTETVTVKAAAARLGISRTLAYELAKADRLPAPVLRLGRRLVVSRLGLERALRGEPGQPMVAGGGDGDAAA